MLRRRAARRQVERAREEMPEGRIGGRYLMREKVFAIGDDFYVQNEQGQNVYKIDGKAFRIRSTLKFEDMQGNEIYKLQERKVRIRDSMNIYRGGEVAAKVHNALITPVRDRFKIEVPGKPDLTTKGNILYHEYVVEREGTPIAIISRKWFRIRNTYGVEVADAEDALLVLAITVCIDMF
jgi:uncharacterized protein YxjI